MFFYIVHLDIPWKQLTTTIAGSNDQGSRFHQLNNPGGISVDNQNQMFYINDSNNHRVVKWSLNKNNSRIVAGGFGQGNGLDQLNRSRDVILDGQDNHLIFAYFGSRWMAR